MADERGGYRKPKGGQPPSGPGRFSRRTDGDDLKRTPGLQNSDLQQGDVSRLEQAQGIAPRAKSPGVAPAASSPSRRGAGGSGASLDLFNMPSANPNEPVTSGLDVGPGLGSDSLTSVPKDEDDLLIGYLERLAYGFNSKVAVETLTEMRTGPAPDARPLAPQAPPQTQPMAPPMGSPAQPEPEEDLELFSEDEEDIAPEEIPAEDVVAEDETMPPVETTDDMGGEAELEGEVDAG